MKILCKFHAKKRPRQLLEKIISQVKQTKHWGSMKGKPHYYHVEIGLLAAPCG
jgi:hypothetical protein